MTMPRVEVITSGSAIESLFCSGDNPIGLRRRATRPLSHVESIGAGRDVGSFWILFPSAFDRAFSQDLFSPMNHSMRYTARW